MTFARKKKALAPPEALAGCQINPIDVNFHLKKSWKLLIKIQLQKVLAYKKAHGCVR